MLKPNARIRRFDVFAEYNRQLAMKRGMKASVAKGYGLWLAKVVAARRFGKTKSDEDGFKKKERTLSQGKWRELSSQPQTDKLFEKEIVDRMGPQFYRRVFAPTIRKAIQNHEEYQEIRDTIREEWVP
ncbi:MAG: hypothetical protein HZB51_09805 [Chloroflexi bacterium]|nr:hypothetical protein [Chloroflexota bacterium]